MAEKTLQQELKYYLPRSGAISFLGFVLIDCLEMDPEMARRYFWHLILFKTIPGGVVFSLIAATLFTLFHWRWKPGGNWTMKWAQFILACILAAGFVSFYQSLMHGD